MGVFQNSERLWVCIDVGLLQDPYNKMREIGIEAETESAEPEAEVDSKLRDLTAMLTGAEVLAAVCVWAWLVENDLCQRMKRQRVA